MTIRTIVLLGLLTFLNSCNSNKSETTTVDSTEILDHKEELKEIQKEVIEVKDVDVDFKKIRKLFENTLGDMYSFNEISEQDRVYQMYSIRPFHTSKYFKLLRAWNNDNPNRWFDLVLYRFDVKSMEHLIECIKDDTHDHELVFGKDWDRVFGIGNNLLRINSGCATSRDDWEKNIMKFELSVTPIYETDWNGYSCKCGGPCATK